MRAVATSFSCRASRAAKLLLLAGAMAFTPATQAINPGQALAQLQHLSWTSRDGAPGSVGALAQTADGYLWLGTPAGLVRFDGARFERIEAPEAGAAFSGDIACLLAGAGGELWIGYRFGRVARFVGGHATMYQQADGLPISAVLALAQDRDGNPWVGTWQGLYRLVAGRWQLSGVEQGLPLRHVQSLLVDGAGALWVAGPEGVFVLRRGAARFETAALPGAQGRLIGGSGGVAWFEQAHGPLQTLAGPPRRIDLQADPRAGVGTGLGLFDRDGALWVQVAGQLERVLPAGTGRQALPAGRRLSGETLLAALEDREGNLWFGTNGGLDRFREYRLWAVPADDGLRLADPVLAPAAGGSVLVGSENAGLRRFAADGTTATPVAPSIVEGVLSLHVDSEGTTWVGGRGRLWRLVDGRATEQALPPEARDFPLQAIAHARDGGLWIAVSGVGTLVARGDAWRINDGLDGLPRQTALSLQADAAGRVWLGYTNDRVGLVENGHARLLGRAEGLDVDTVLAFDIHGEHAWIGGSGGVALWDGQRFWPLTGSEGQRPAGVSGVVQSAAGELWINGVGGITHVSAADVAAFQHDPASARPRLEVFDAEDGLEGLPEQLRPVPSVVEASDGRLWFATTAGVFSIAPEHIARNALAPNVLVQSVTSNGRRHDAADGLVLPQHTTGLEIAYTATSLAAPGRVRFRYRLEGVDEGWQEAGARRVAYYTNLRAGNYRFRVVAANEDGVWNETGASLRFTIAPAFWQSPWFSAACVAAAAALAWALLSLRSRLRAARRRARAQERERIARDLHDTLLQGTQGLILEIQCVAARLPRQAPERTAIERSLDDADRMLAETRDRVYGLRGQIPFSDDLAERLAHVGRQTFADTPTRFAVNVKGAPRPLREEALDELSQAGREALLNAARHARASEVGVDLVHGARRLRLVLHDDGIGIAPGVLAAGARTGHWGLVGMRERAQRLGGTLAVRSEPGAGTTVTLEVPAAFAYRPSPGGWRTWVAALQRAVAGKAIEF